MQILSLLTKCLNCFWPILFIAVLAKRFHGFPFPQSCLKKSQHFQHSKVKLCPQNDIVFFFLLNKIKCLRSWVSKSHLSKEQVEWKSFVFAHFFFHKKKKKFPVFAFLHFTLIETPPTFKSAELLQTNLDWIRYPRNVVTNLMKRINLKKVFGRKERRKMIGGKKEYYYKLVKGRR